MFLKSKIILSFNNLDIFSKFNALNSFHSVPIMIADDPSQASYAELNKTRLVFSFLALSIASGS